MNKLLSIVRESCFYGASRIIFLTMLAAFPLTAQESYFESYTLTAGSSYDDIFRQTTDFSRTLIFQRHSFASLSAVKNDDSLSISIAGKTQYAAYAQHRTSLTGALNNSFYDIALSYTTSLSFFRTSGTIGKTVNEFSDDWNYGFSISADPFNRRLTAEISFERSSLRIGTSMLFKDFFVPLVGAPDHNTVSYTITLTPLNDISGTIHYFDASVSSADKTDPFSVKPSLSFFGKTILVEYFWEELLPIVAEFSTMEMQSDLRIYKDRLTFGYLNDGSVKFSRYRAGASLNGNRLPMTMEYLYEQAAFNGFGHVESWPFTSLAASIITNRFHYQFSGMVKHHALNLSTLFHFGATSQLTTVLSYHRILPDAAFEQWEPEFLVFGMKNYARNPFAIIDAHLAGIALQLTLPIRDVECTFIVKQYLPLSLMYRDRGPTAPSPAPVQPANAVTMTDGGRSAGLLVRYTF